MSSTQITNPWLLTRAVNPHARLNLICFPYAGGGAQIFNSWQTGLITGEIQVYGVQYPGRGSRVREQAFTESGALVDAFLPHLLPLLSKPFALFGHSMGAIIAFEVARRLQNERGLRPQRLIVSGRRAAQLPRTDRLTYNLPDAEFTEELRRLNGTPKEVLDHPELMQLMMGIIRADFTLTQTYKYVPGPQLTCPLSVFGGLDDTDVAREQLEAWCQQTTSDCSLKMFEGDHFFIQTNQAAVLKTIRQQLLH
ncbi:MAG TPA: alpha/beta fold hydrolase [Pyrinomonadaceae bacterium]|nr:alpha/beta fold hydrolase [Pyrinomonadaceae bacterium]